MPITKKQILLGSGSFLAGAVFAASWLVLDLEVADPNLVNFRYSLEHPKVETISGVVKYQQPEALLVETTGQHSLLVLDFENGQAFQDQISGAYNRLRLKLDDRQPLTVTGLRYQFGSRPIIIVQAIH